MISNAERTADSPLNPARLAKRFVGPLGFKHFEDRFIQADRCVLLSAQPIDPFTTSGDERPRHERSLGVKRHLLGHGLEGDVLEDILRRVGIANDQPSGRGDAIPLAHGPLQNALFSWYHQMQDV